MKSVYVSMHTYILSRNSNPIHIYAEPNFEASRDTTSQSVYLDRHTPVQSGAHDSSVIPWSTFRSLTIHCRPGWHQRVLSYSVPWGVSEVYALIAGWSPRTLCSYVLNSIDYHHGSHGMAYMFQGMYANNNRTGVSNAAKAIPCLWGLVFTLIRRSNVSGTWVVSHDLFCFTLRSYPWTYFSFTASSTVIRAIDDVPIMW